MTYLRDYDFVYGLRGDCIKANVGLLHGKMANGPISDDVISVNLIIVKSNDI